jgi:drug/metabolite transporter (DMT)-like permease
MAAWALPALLAAGCIAVHYLTLRAASGRIGPALGALVLEGAAAVGILVLWVTRIAPSGPTHGIGVFWSAVSGLCISGASVLLFVALRLGGHVAATGTLVLGGGVAISALVAPFLFGEVFTVRRAIGVALGLAGVAVLATDRS